MTKIKCNGYSLPHTRFSDNAQKILTNLLHEMRPVFIVENDIKNNDNVDQSLHTGYRFYDNESALVRIYSATTEEEAMKNPSEWVKAALKDCAGSDYWYTYEKQWD